MYKLQNKISPAYMIGHLPLNRADHVYALKKVYSIIDRGGGDFDFGWWPSYNDVSSCDVSH